jgi:hypothetical protein
MAPYKVLKNSKLEPKATVGTTIYECAMCDYGVASDDSRILGVEHRSFTLKANGDYPFFTMPLSDVERIDD